MTDNELVALLIGAISSMIVCFSIFVYFDYKYTKLIIAIKHHSFKEGYDLAAKLHSTRHGNLNPNPGTFK